MNKAEKLTEAAREAATVRGYATDPDVVALRIERIRAWCDRLVWTGIVLGLLFTMANVQHFAAGTAARTPWTPGAWKDGTAIDWIIAWLLDPMVSLVLIGVLMGEQVINRHGIAAGGWVRITKWVALGCTYGMNTWSAWTSGNPASILLHSVPPVIVVCATEAVPTLRRQITEAVTLAYRAAVDQAEATELRPVVEPLDLGDPGDLELSDALDGTPPALLAWLKGEPVPAVPPAPDPHQVQAASLFADEVRNGKVPGIKRLQKALRIGQDKAYEVQAYLDVLASK